MSCQLVVSIGLSPGEYLPDYLKNHLNVHSLPNSADLPLLNPEVIIWEISRMPLMFHAEQKVQLCSSPTHGHPSNYPLHCAVRSHPLS